MGNTTRRNFLKSATAAVGAGVAARSYAAGRSRVRKPNLLFLWTDEQRADTMRVYGNDKISVPNLNRLADESIVFERAYVSQPVCTPSRSTVMTGLWPHTTGCTKNNIPLPTDVPCLPEIVNDPAYRTAYMGKWHLGDEIFRQHGFDEWQSIEDNYIKYYRNGRDKSARSQYWHFLNDLGYKPDEKNIYNRTYASNLPIGHSKPAFLEKHACDFIRRHSDRPFMLYVNFLEPHPPYNGPFNDIYDPDTDVALPNNFNDPLEDNEPVRCIKRRQDVWTKKVQGIQLRTDDAWRSLVARYWGLVTEVDHAVGNILDTLDELGLADNTIVVYTSDHGDMMGSHKMLYKSVMYEEATRIPWLMRVPQLGRRQRIIKKPVSHIDLVPTLLDLMGAKTKTDLPGQSLVPLIKGGTVAEEDVFIEWRPHFDWNSELLKNRSPNVHTKSKTESRIRTVVTPDGWKLCLADNDRSELFNLNTDPGETKNLFYEKQYAPIIEKLTAKIRAWQKRVGDA
ncbi:MAG: sulfatase-like hydrolase/transferase [Candidatus Hydrogenedentes bacterium]|nr:sulfatase-like hydrolase/transferase [Candidatus Hydrogenedentota bacterium]